MKCTGAQIVIECLLEKGVDTVFGYPGGTILNIYDELYKSKDRINHIRTAHEQGACHAADGYQFEGRRGHGDERSGMHQSGNRDRDRLHGFGTAGGHYL